MIKYIKKVKTVTLKDNEKYDIYLAIKNGKLCYIDDLGYNYNM